MSSAIAACATLSGPTRQTTPSVSPQAECESELSSAPSPSLLDRTKSAWQKTLFGKKLANKKWSVQNEWVKPDGSTLVTGGGPWTIKGSDAGDSFFTGLYDAKLGEERFKLLSMYSINPDTMKLYETCFLSDGRVAYGVGRDNGKDCLVWDGVLNDGSRSTAFRETWTLDATGLHGVTDIEDPNNTAAMIRMDGFSATEAK